VGSVQAGLSKALPALLEQGGSLVSSRKKTCRHLPSIRYF